MQIFAVGDERKRDLLWMGKQRTLFVDSPQSATCRFSFVVNRTENVCFRFFNKHQTQYCIKMKVLKSFLNKITTDLVVCTLIIPVYY